MGSWCIKKTQEKTLNLQPLFNWLEKVQGMQQYAQPPIPQTPPQPQGIGQAPPSRRRPMEKGYKKTNHVLSIFGDGHS